ncbi:MAG: thiolase C-terminal domain-containing protein [Thermoplasmatota archaeon]
MECGRTISNMYIAGAAGGYYKDEIRVADDGLYAGALAWLRLKGGLFRRTMVLAYGQTSEVSPEGVANLVFDPIFQRPFGLGRTGALALEAEAYRHAAPKETDSAAEAWVNRASAAPRAEDALPAAESATTRDERASFSSFPLRHRHIAPACDGAAAIVMERSDAPPVAGRRPSAAVRARGFGWACDPGYLGSRNLRFQTATARAAADAYAAAGVGAAEITWAEVHDPTAFHGLMALEALGLFPERGAGKFVLSEGPSPSDSPATPAAHTPSTAGPHINASGGSFGGEPSAAGGLYRMAAVVRAVRGRSGSGSRMGLAHSTSGPASQTSCVAIVEGVPP